MKKILLSIILLSFNSIADIRDDLDRYQFEYDSIISKQNISPRDQMLANDLIEKINEIKKNNPDITKNTNKNSSVIDDISKTKDFVVKPDESENKRNLGISDNLKNWVMDNIKNNDNSLTRDQEDACGAILCLASSNKVSECASYLKRYFSIKIFKHGSLKWGQTVNARRNFLNICPIDNRDRDKEMDNLITDVLPNQRGNCTADELNAMVDVRIRQIRTINKIPEYCEILAKHSYTDINLPEYKCDSKFYNLNDWNRGYYLEETDFKSYKEWINNGNAGHIDRSNQLRPIYYKHINIIKKCWFNKKTGD